MGRRRYRDEPKPGKIASLIPAVVVRKRSTALIEWESSPCALRTRTPRGWTNAKGRGLPRPILQRKQLLDFRLTSCSGVVEGLPRRRRPER